MKISSIIILVGLVMGASILFLGPSNTNSNTKGSQPIQNVEIKDGVQYITIEANGGYSPQKTDAQANIPTKLIVKTNNTYDCSSALVIRSIGYQKLLPPSGEEVIDLGSPETGTFRGLCSMGMYSFIIDF